MLSMHAFEIIMKLLGWFHISYVLPLILLNYVIPRELEEKYPPYAMHIASALTKIIFTGI